ncbi:hypothetical protein GCM10027512_05740 [Chromohalobacter beijerinckii]
MAYQFVKLGAIQAPASVVIGDVFPGPAEMKAAHCLSGGEAQPFDRRFEVTVPNVAWVTDITYICIYEGWLSLLVVIDLISRQVVGWSMQSRMTTDLALDALLAAVWRRRPQEVLMVHSDSKTTRCQVFLG